jgi:FtsZ-interacting cell division protein ZipA
MDSELQIGLIALGVAAVVGIIAYNKWQERKHRKHAERAFSSDHRDVLLEPQGADVSPDDRVEPWEIDAPATEPQAVPTGEGSNPRRATQTSGRHTTPGAPDDVDTRIDCVIRIESIEPLAATRLWQTQRDKLQGLDKPVRWYAFDDRENLWRLLAADSDGAHHWFCAAMQLVNRRGAIGEREFQLFASGVQDIADQFLAVPADIPARAAALAGAAEVDRFCESVDVQIGINVVSTGEAFNGTKIRALAESAGMVLANDGTFHAQDGDGRTTFTLCNMEDALFSAGEMRDLHTHGVTLIIDVPLVADGVGVFDRLMRHATQFAETLHGSIVDDNRTPLGPDATTLIRAQIQQFQAQMASNNISAGSALAQRLFSTQ